MTNDKPWPSAGVAWYAVFVLFIAFIFSFIDRIILGMLVDPIKADLGVSEFQMGWLQGLAFALFYALVGIPIGRWADRYSRRRIIGIGICLWSLMTAACGLARGFWTLFLARVGVGVGEAALSPAAYSMISDLFPRERLGRALAIYQSGAFFGAGVAFLVGGFVIQLAMGADNLTFPVIGTVKPWQVVFFVVGMPGVFVAMLMLTVKEPERRGKLAGHGDEIAIAEVWAYARDRRRLFVSHFCGFALIAVPITTVLTWIVPYYVRVLGFTPPEVGYTLGPILVVLSPAGVYCGGLLVDWLQKRGVEDAIFRVGIAAALLLLPISFLATTGSDPRTAVWLFGPMVFCASLPLVLAPAALQLVVPNQMRAQVSATWMLALNIITAGVGPTAVGFFTQFLFGDDLAVGRSIALVNCVCVPISALVLWFGLKPFRSAVREVAAG